jgi:N-methylhydantoinase A
MSNSNQGPEARSARISVDIGGTFTDLVLLDASGTSFSRKVPSTPAHPAEAVIAGIALILADAQLAPGDVSEVLHGTTVGSNTLLQKVGARTGLLTTRGFRDVLEIGRIRTPEMFDLTWDKPQPLVRRQWRREIDERIDAQGQVLTKLDPAQVMQIGGELVTGGVESIAICFINSYRNPAHEIAAERILRQNFPHVPVTTSVSVLPEQREYERTSTATVNAYVLPIMQAYLKQLRLGLREIGITAPLLVGNSNGGLSSAETAEAKPVFFISSGRSAGVMGAARLGDCLERPDLIVFDMGGTTASASLVQGGEIARATEYEFRDGISTPSRFIKAGGYMMTVPTIDVAEVGSGAGSIANLDAGGLLRVGPVSAGAEPGPACYGRGGMQPTVTDANVALGLLPETLAGGALTLDRNAALAAIERTIARPLGVSVDLAASGIRDMVNANMTRAIRAVTVERGVDPRDFTLLAFGGSGPLHACDIALTLDIPHVLFPRMPGVFTAMGMLTSDMEHYFIRPNPGLLRNLDTTHVAGIIAALRTEALARMELDGFGDRDIDLAFSIDLRFIGQDAAIPVPLPSRFDSDTHIGLRRDFIQRYEQLYHYASADEVEMTSIRLVARGIRGNKLDFDRLQLPRSGRLAVTTERQVHFGSRHGWMLTPIVPRDTFTGEVDGPVIIESSDSTVVIPPSVSVRADRQGNLLAALPQQTQHTKRSKESLHV